MIEKVILDYLSGCLSVPALMEVPEEPPASFVVLEKTGSSCENRLYRATFAVQSYGKTLLAAVELNEKVKAAMDSLPELDEVASSRLNGDYNFTDTTTKRYRYQVVYDITHY